MNITPEQKKRRFRELAKDDRIRTGRQLDEEFAQPFLIDVEKYSAKPGKGRFSKETAKTQRARMPVHAFLLRGRYDDTP
jgi:hypothetical protein